MTTRKVLLTGKAHKLVAMIRSALGVGDKGPGARWGAGEAVPDAVGAIGILEAAAVHDVRGYDTCC
jgi:hypothetical protein